ncbi:MAG: 5'/3'-nucleotidase SurE [Acidimicrobiales bacterium]
MLITNDDGIMAPGIAALAASASAAGHEILVAAPLTDYSGSSAAVGPVYERTSVDYKAFEMDGLDGIPSYGLDASPALCVLLCCLGAFGPPPELVLSGINHGANIGRSVLHSGTVGAALTAAHFHISAIAVSIKYGPDPVPWETPATLAQQLASRIADAPPGTVLNLNVPNIHLGELQGIAWGSLGRSGLIKAAATGETGMDRSGTLPKLSVRSLAGAGPNTQTYLPGAPKQNAGSIMLELVAPTIVGTPATASRSETPLPGADTDASLIAQGYASVTPLTATHESADAATSSFVQAAVEEMLDLHTTARTDNVRFRQ